MARATRRVGILFETPVEHGPWPLSNGIVEQLTETLLGSAGLPAPDDDPLMNPTGPEHHWGPDGEGVVSAR
jgi:hypothetical protein